MNKRQRKKARQKYEQRLLRYMRRLCRRKGQKYKGPWTVEQMEVKCNPPTDLDIYDQYLGRFFQEMGVSARVLYGDGL